MFFRHNTDKKLNFHAYVKSKCQIQSDIVQHTVLPYIKVHTHNLFITFHLYLVPQQYLSFEAQLIQILLSVLNIVIKLSVPLHEIMNSPGSRMTVY